MVRYDFSDFRADRVRAISIRPGCRAAEQVPFASVPSEGPCFSVYIVGRPVPDRGYPGYAHIGLGFWRCGSPSAGGRSFGRTLSTAALGCASSTSTARRLFGTNSTSPATSSTGIELAAAHPRSCYRRMWALLRGDGWCGNRKRIERLWRLEGHRGGKRQRRAMSRRHRGSQYRRAAGLPTAPTSPPAERPRP